MKMAQQCKTWMEIQYPVLLDGYLQKISNSVDQQYQCLECIELDKQEQYEGCHLHEF